MGRHRGRRCGDEHRYDLPMVATRHPLLPCSLAHLPAVDFPRLRGAEPVAEGGPGDAERRQIDFTGKLYLAPLTTVRFPIGPGV